MINKSGRCINQYSLIKEIIHDIILLNKWNHTFSFWVFKFKEILLILLELFYTHWSQTQFLSNILPTLSILFITCFFLFLGLSFLSSLSFCPFLFEKTRCCLFFFLFILKWCSSWFKCPLAELIFTRTFKCLIIDWFLFINLN